MIHEALYKDHVALRYYKKIFPRKKLDRAAAGKKWHQEKNIDKKVLNLVIDEILIEQKKLLA